MNSLIIPVYKNEESLPELIEACRFISDSVDDELEVVFVVDGSPDRSFLWLETELPKQPFRTQLILHSKNFGSYQAIRTGLEHAGGDCFAVMAADLQEPPELINEFFKSLREGGADVVLGTRSGRADPLFSRVCSSVYWGIYRRFIQPEMPAGGVDIFGCNRRFRDELLRLGESNTSFVGLLLWLGFRRQYIPYERRSRKFGKSAWSFSRKVRYLLDSVFAFSDLPVRILVYAGTLGLFLSTTLGVMVLIAKLSGAIPIPGYTTIVLTVLLFAGLNSFGLGIIGSYIWRAFENTKNRPLAVVRDHIQFEGDAE